MNKSREELVQAILKISKNPETLLILAISENEELEEIYCKLYNIC